MTQIRDATGERIARPRPQQLERDVRGWSQAKRAGVPKATVSRIERREMSPAVLLVKLVGAFDLTLAGLLLRAAGDGRRLSRAAEQQRWRDPASRSRRTQVFMCPDHPLEAVRVELPAGERGTLPASSYAQIRQLVLALHGELVIVEGGERHVLSPGDCLGPPSEVSLANDTAEDCSDLVLLARR